MDLDFKNAVYPSLSGRSVFVTGGGSGIGASIVEHFCAQGAKVAFVDIAEEASRELVETTAGQGFERPLFIPCDLRNIEALRSAIGDAERRHGGIRVLVNNAANDDRHDFAEVTPAYWDDRMAVNLRHQFFAAQAVFEQMRSAGGGSIINFGSISWMNAEGGYAAYTACKAAVQGLTRGLARDFGRHNIRVNTLVPGWVMTERQVRLWLDEAGERQLFENQCIKKKVYPPDIARMVLFLAADDSRMCTSQDFVVDAGWT